MSTFRSSATGPSARRPRGPVAPRQLPVDDPAVTGAPSERPATRPAHLAPVPPAAENATAVDDATPPPLVGDPAPAGAPDTGTDLDELPPHQPPADNAATPEASSPAPEPQPRKALVVLHGGLVQHADPGVHVVDLDDAATLQDPHELLDLLIQLNQAVADSHSRSDAANALLSLIRDRV